MEYHQWLRTVAAWVRQGCGLELTDLPPQPYADWFWDGMEPQAAARLAMRLSMSPMVA